MSFVKKLAGLFGRSEAEAPEAPVEEMDVAAGREEAPVVEVAPEPPAPDGRVCETLHACAETPGSAAQCRLLLDQGANALAGDVEGRTPLHIAAVKGNLEVLKLLCAEVISVDPLDDHRVSPLLFALRSPEPGAQEGAQFLTTKGAKLTLNVAFALGDVHLINRIFLDDRKAFQTCKAPEELLTDLIRAIGRKCDEKAGGALDADARAALETPIMDKYVPIIQRIADAGLDPDAYGIAGRPPLFDAVQFESTLLAESLLKLGADPNSISQADETPLQVAGTGRPRMQALLREHGAA